MSEGSQTAKAEAPPLVAVLDDDAGIRKALDRLLSSVGFKVACFGTAQDLFASEVLHAANCLILDIRLLQVSGLDFQNQLIAAAIRAKRCLDPAGTGRSTATP